MRALAIAMLSLALPGSALASEPTFPVMNIDEEPPDGVVVRNAPDPRHTDRVDGHGVYKGEHVRVKCYAHGTPFGPHDSDVCTTRSKPNARRSAPAQRGGSTPHYVG